MLMSKEFQLGYTENLDSCDFKISNIDLYGNPIPIPYAYFYESGIITYTKKDCGIRNYFDVFGCFCNKTAYMCDLEGTFNLTFKNDLGERITLTDGKFSQPSVIQ